MTDEELDALVQRLTWAAGIDQAEYPFPLCNDAADAITTLRAERDDARAERDKMGRALNVARYGQPDFSWELHKMAMREAVEQRDRAEAELAAQIEADAGICAALYRMALKDSDDDLSSPWKSHRASAYGTALQAIRAQPHDRTALDEMLQAEREKALREAADFCYWNAVGLQPRKGYVLTGWTEDHGGKHPGMAYHAAILAMTPREIGSGGKT